MRWKILSNKQKSTGAKEQSVDEIISTLLVNRGFKTKKEQNNFLHPSLEGLNQDFFDKQQLAAAISQVQSAIRNQEQIIVYSDYDVDGVTGGAILWEVLDSLGAKVMPYVPNRMEEGYGMSKKGIDKILSLYPAAKLVITVDHGITAVDQTKYAKEKGLDVIITDHHTVGQELPKADAIIHTTKLAGSGVAYIFSRYICHPEFSSGFKSDSILRHIQHADQENDEHLALAAIGTIGDLVPLVGLNRVIAKFGLGALNKTKRIGLLSLFETAGLLGKKIGTYEVGFVIAPRINASGRLTHALDALRLLCTKSEPRARKLALLLNATNLKRQTIMSQINDHAVAQVDHNSKLLFVAHESYHEGVIGLVAGRLVEKYYRPSIVISKGTILSKASARSIAGFNIVEAIRSSSDLLLNVGGHPMAAGFTVQTENLILLEEKLRRYVDEALSGHLLEKQLPIDMEISFSAVSMEILAAIQAFAPFGVGNPEPLFATKNVSILDASRMGSDNMHLRLRLEKDGIWIDAVGFGMGYLYKTLSPDKTINIAYAISENTWNGNTKLQLKIKDIN